MTISKIAESTKLTKKAIRYYESIGLINSKVLGNGYRDYSNENLEKLIIIKMLRDLSFSIEEIKLCFADEKNLHSKFSSKSKQLQEDKKQLSMNINFLNNFVLQGKKLSNLTEFQEDITQLMENRQIQLRDNLQQVFPGDFGEVLSAVYGQFLDEIILTPEQKEAWQALIIELDELEPLEIPQNLVLWAKTINVNSKEFKDNSIKLKDEYNQTYEEFNKNKKEFIQEYLNKDYSKPINNQELLLFLSKNCKEVVNILGRYLPLVSKNYEQFYLKQNRFIHDNSNLIDKLSKH